MRTDLVDHHTAFQVRGISNSKGIFVAFCIIYQILSDPTTLVRFSVLFEAAAWAVALDCKNHLDADSEFIFPGINWSVFLVRGCALKMPRFFSKREMLTENASAN